MALLKKTSSESYVDTIISSLRIDQEGILRVPQKRFNDDWHYLETKSLRPHATADEFFDASYKQQGLSGKFKNQPTNPVATSPKKVTGIMPIKY